MNGIAQILQGLALRVGNNLSEIAAAGAAAQLAARTNIGASSSAADLLALVGGRSVSPSLFSDGATASRRAEMTPGAVGAVAGKIISIPFQIDVPASNPSAGIQISSFNANGTASPTITAYGFSILVQSTGALQVYQTGATFNDYRYLQYAGFLAAYSGQQVRGMVVFPYPDTATAPVIYLQGLDTTASFALTTGGAAPNWVPAALDTTKFLSGYNWSGRYFPHAPILGELSAAEVLSWAQSGRLPTWCELGAGSAVASYTSDFSAGSDLWAANSNQTVTGNIDANADGAGVPPSDNWLKAVNTAARTLTFYRSPAAPLNAHGKFKFTADIFVPVGSPITHVFLADSDVSTPSNPVALVAGAVTSISGILSSRSGGLSINGNSSASTTLAGIAAGNALYVKNLLVYRLGPLARWEIQPGAVIHADSGENRLALVTVPGITALGDLPQTVVLPGAPLTANGFVHLDQVITPAAYELVAAYALQTLTEASTITVKETSAGGTTVATGALSATAARVALTVSNGLLAGGKKLYLSNSAWAANTVTPFFVFRRAG